MDKNADTYKAAKGKLEADSSLNDSELIPYKVDNEQYFKNEVLPYVPSAWLEDNEDNITMGCEINFNKYFYEYTAPEKSGDILNRIKSIEATEKALEEELYGTK